jgi:phosphoribosylformylglycinamidine synthase
VGLTVENADTAFTNAYEQGQHIRIPIAHGEGQYVADDATLDALEASRRVVFRYTDRQGRATPEANPNGSARNIAGILNEAGNVLGLMPHPERVSLDILGKTDGRGVFQSLIAAVEARSGVAARNGSGGPAGAGPDRVARVGAGS